jgi:hypothetical protein
MNYKILNEYVKKFQLEKYISLFKNYTLYDKEYSLFYLKKSKLFWRFKNGFSKKYIVFQNCDLEYGKHKNERAFNNIDEASNYLWELFTEYAYKNNYIELINIIKK